MKKSNAWGNSTASRLLASLFCADICVCHAGGVEAFFGPSGSGILCFLLLCLFSLALISLLHLLGDGPRGVAALDFEGGSVLARVLLMDIGWHCRKLGFNADSVDSMRTLFPVRRGYICELRLTLGFLLGIGHGTKYALKLGGMRLKSMHKQFLDKPRLPFEGDSVTGTAASDPWNSLKSGQCHVFAGERWLEGWFVVWRFPVMLPSDVRLWEAKAPPPQARNFPRNTIICTREEDTVTKASGGDTDGDGLCLTNDPRVVDLVRTTPDGHERVEASIARVKEQLTPQASSTLVHEEDYIKYISQVSTVDVKSFVCVQAEKAIFASCTCVSAD